MLNKFFSTKKNPENIREVFYLRGFQRSGTNWLCNLLNLHPDINCKGEFHLERFFSAKKNAQENEDYLYDNKRFEKQFFNFVDNIVLDTCGDFPLCGDRTPTGIMSTLVPNRKYILITRDGRDCMVSWFYHCLRKGILVKNQNMKMRKDKFDFDPAYFETHKHELLQMKGYMKKIAHHWNYRIKNDLKAISKSKELDISCYWVKYEELLLNTDKIRNELYNFLGVDPAKAKSLNNLTTPGFEKHDPNSHNRKGAAGRWNLYFTEEQHNWFLSEAAEGLELLELPLTYTGSFNMT